ncbi:alginate lyase family protein [Pseudaestuariivita sp.]|uniref:alginate lyase family protein n=1 Tax=Pseudaestuariivita sp. TaxID=2211669 RepID=UPI004058DB03
MRALLAGAVVLCCGATPVAAECVPPEPVHGLSFGSRYVEGTGSTVIDDEAEAEAVEQLKPVDDLIRDLARAADDVLDGDVGAADCVIETLYTWAEAGALGALKSDTSRLTIASRIAGLALVARKIQTVDRGDPRWFTIHDWLGGLMQAQRIYWEAEAPNGAKRGNLRGWAALAGASVAELTEDPVLRAWAVWSASYVMCTASEDGSLPQEMGRGKHALHYQLHAVAPLTVTAKLVAPHGYDLMAECDRALPRAARFAVEDLQSGAASARHSGEVQSFFDGSRDLGGFQLAWLEAYLAMRADPQIAAMAETWRPLSNSKLGGRQTGVWEP